MRAHAESTRVQICVQIHRWVSEALEQWIIWLWDGGDDKRSSPSSVLCLLCSVSQLSFFDLSSKNVYQWAVDGEKEKGKEGKVRQRETERGLRWWKKHLEMERQRKERWMSAVVVSGEGRRQLWRRMAACVCVCGSGGKGSRLAGSSLRRSGPLIKSEGQTGGLPPSFSSPLPPSFALSLPSRWLFGGSMRGAGEGGGKRGGRREGGREGAGAPTLRVWLPVETVNRGSAVRPETQTGR